MKLIKLFLKYIVIFIISALLLFSSLIVTAKIPKEAIKTNLEKSVEFFKQNRGIEELLPTRDYTTLHLYADSVLLNIIYCINPDKPVESVMWSKFYQKVYADINNDFIEAVEKEKEPTQQYLRYWHGSMAIIRPLLTVFNIEQIYMLNRNIVSNIINNIANNIMEKE